MFPKCEHNFPTSRKSWPGASLRAISSRLPTKPDFSASTHRSRSRRVILTPRKAPFRMRTTKGTLSSAECFSIETRAQFERWTWLRRQRKKARGSQRCAFVKVCSANKLPGQAREPERPPPAKDKKMKFVSTLTATCMVMLALASCANTIKGVGRDAANTVNATQNAGKRVGNAAAN